MHTLAREAVQKPEDVLQAAAGLFDLYREPDSPLITKMDGYAKRGTDMQHGRDLVNPSVPFDPNYHLEDRWLDQVPAPALEYLNEAVSNIRRCYPDLGGYLQVFRH